MCRRDIFFALALGLPLALSAHEGHDHKALGTVTAVQEGALELETTEHATLSFVLVAETTYRRGDARAARSDVKPGLRAAVTYFEKTGKKIAREVRLPAASDAPKDRKR